MKKLCRKGTVHPSPPSISDLLAFLPATILTLTAALSPEDREVLAYLLSCSVSSGNFSGQRRNTQRNTNSKLGADHPKSFNCGCFRCYMCYWVRWDSSPNRQLIHEILDAFEDGLLVQSKDVKNKKERRKKGSNHRSGELTRFETSSGGAKLGELESVEESGGGSGGGFNGEEESFVVNDEELGMENGSLRKFVRFIGERIWGVWA